MGAENLKQIIRKKVCSFRRLKMRIEKLAELSKSEEQIWVDILYVFEQSVLVSVFSLNIVVLPFFQWLKARKTSKSSGRFGTIQVYWEKSKNRVSDG